jgi:hydrogenase nickel incorporation protein HypB
MCATCGCSDDAAPTLTDPSSGQVTSLAEHPHEHGTGDDSHQHDHGHPHDHNHEPGHAAGRTISFEEDVLAKNNRLAERNRGWFVGRQVLALNLMSSPGAGKTTLLVRTITDLGSELEIGVVEGDQETILDAERIGATKARVVQINTGSGCHLDASMLASGVASIDPPTGSILMIENVGNLVCPAMFDLGEHARVVIMSVTEGADKPLKYPQMFRSADIVLLNKIDLAPYVDFDIDDCLAAIRRVNPAADVLPVSATKGDGLDEWYRWLREQHTKV